MRCCSHVIRSRAWSFSSRFCVQIPLAGGQLLEVAAEDFFRTMEETMGTSPCLSSILSGLCSSLLQYRSLWYTRSLTYPWASRGNSWRSLLVVNVMTKAPRRMPVRMQSPSCKNFIPRSLDSQGSLFHMQQFRVSVSRPDFSSSLILQ